MKAIIWIIVLLLVGWGIWKWMDKGPADNTQPAAAVEGLNYDANADGSSASDADSTDGVDVEDKG